MAISLLDAGSRVSLGDLLEAPKVALPTPVDLHAHMMWEQLASQLCSTRSPLLVAVFLPEDKYIKGEETVSHISF